jgi:hypothetical protein
MSLDSLVTRFRRSKRGVEVLTGNLLMIMVMAAVFSSVAFMVRNSSDNYAQAQEEEMIEGISLYLRSKISEAWGVGADEIPLDLPDLIGSRPYIVEEEAGGKYLRIRTDRGTYRVESAGVAISKRGIRSSEASTIGIREGRVVINPPPLTEIVQPLDGSVYNDQFVLSYRTSLSAETHSIYIDGREVATSSTTLDGYVIDPDTYPTNVSDGQHTLGVVASNGYGDGADYVRFVVDRVPPQVDLNMTQIMTGELKIMATEITAMARKVEMYVFVSDDKNLPVRELDTSNFYVYNNDTEAEEGGRFSIRVVATDSESRVDPKSYMITRNHQSITSITRSKEGRWDTKEYNGSTHHWGTASDIAGNVGYSENVTKYPINRPVTVGSPDRKSDLSIIFTNDVSGSMNWVMWKDEPPKEGEESRLDFMKSAVKGFIDRMFPEDEAAICSFSYNYVTGSPEIGLVRDFTPTTETGKSQLQASVDTLSAMGGTPLYDALYQSVLWVRDRSKFRAVLVLTDGKDLNYATGEPYSSRTSDEVIDLAREAGIPIYCVGLGEEDKVDVAVLTAISDQTEGRFYLAPTPEKLQEAYDQIAGELLSGYKITYTPGYTIAGGEDLTIMVYDKDDRSGSLKFTLPVPIGNLPPGVSVTSPNGGEAIAGTYQIQWTATDPEGDPLLFDLYCSSDGGSTWSPIASGLAGVGPSYSYSWDTTSVFDGNHFKVKVIADDGEATTQDMSDSVFEVDNVPPDAEDPVVTISKPTYPPAKKVSGVYTIQGSASDTGGAGLHKVELWIGGIYQGDATLLAGDSWEFDFDTTTLPNGIVTVEAWAYDRAGNDASDTIEMEVNN